MSRAFWITIAVVFVIFGVGYTALLNVMSADLTPTAQNSDVIADLTTKTTKTRTDTDNGSTVILKVSETLAIRLDTHSGGGYQYSLDRYDQAILRLDKDETIEPNSTDSNGREIVGAGNLEQWTFTALKPGITTVELTNFRSFEPRPMNPTFTLTVVVE